MVNGKTNADLGISKAVRPVCMQLDPAKSQGRKAGRHIHHQSKIPSRDPMYYHTQPLSTGWTQQETRHPNTVTWTL